MIRRVSNERCSRMRAAAIGFVIALALAPSVAFAQAASPGGPPPGGAGAPPPPGAISRDQFIQQRAEAAGRLFDQIDTNHTGYITRAQFRAFMRARRAGGPQPGAAGPPSQQ
jgi:EF hand domain-containing protein